MWTITGPAKRVILKTPDDLGTGYYVSINPALVATELTEFSFCAAIFAETFSNEEDGHWLFNYGRQDGSTFSDYVAFGFGEGYIGYKVGGNSLHKHPVR